MSAMLLAAACPSFHRTVGPSARIKSCGRGTCEYLHKVLIERRTGERRARKKRRKKAETCVLSSIVALRLEAMFLEQPVRFEAVVRRLGTNPINRRETITDEIVISKDLITEPFRCH